MGGGLSHQRIRHSPHLRPTRQSACALAIDVEQSPFAFARAERWPSGRRHQIANLAYWVTGTEGSNPSLSAKLLHFLALSIVVKPPSKRSDWRGWGQGGVDLTSS